MMMMMMMMNSLGIAPVFLVYRVLDVARAQKTSRLTLLLWVFAVQ
jgi:hypothetical protein